MGTERLRTPEKKEMLTFDVHLQHDVKVVWVIML